MTGSQPQAGCVVVGTSIIGIAFKWNYDYYYVLIKINYYSITNGCAVGEAIGSLVLNTH